MLTPEEADVAVLRLVAPSEQRGVPGSIEFFMHAGSLDFSAEQLTHIRSITDRVPTILDVYLDRPAILAPLKDLGASLMVNFGATDEALARVLFGEAEPKGRLLSQRHTGRLESPPANSGRAASALAGVRPINSVPTT